MAALSVAGGMSSSGLSKFLREPDHSPTLETIEKLAQGLEISPVFLAFGVETLGGAASLRRPSIPVAGAVGAGAVVEDPRDPSSWTDLREVELPGVENVEALLVRGDSQYPRFFDGDFVLFENIPRTPGELANQLAIVQTMDGRRLLKILRPVGGDQWLLESLNSPAEITKVLAAFRYLGVLSARPSIEEKAKKKRA